MRKTLIVILGLALLSFGFNAEAQTDAGWIGDLYGGASIWNIHYNDPHSVSYHAAQLINRNEAGSVTYSWEFKHGLPEHNISEQHEGSGSLKAGELVHPSTGLWIDLDAHGLQRGVTYGISLYSRMDVAGIGGWRVDVNTTVTHPKK